METLRRCVQGWGIYIIHISYSYCINPPPATASLSVEAPLVGERKKESRSYRILKLRIPSGIQKGGKAYPRPLCSCLRLSARTKPVDLSPKYITKTTNSKVVRAAHRHVGAPRDSSISCAAWRGHGLPNRIVTVCATKQQKAAFNFCFLLLLLKLVL